MTDMLGDGPEAPLDEDGRPSWLELVDEPMTLAFTAFPLAVLMMLGSTLFRGVLYTAAFAPENEALVNGSDGAPGFLVSGACLSAAFCVIPLVLGLRGLRRTLPADPGWLRGLLQAAVALSGLALLLRLVLVLVVVTGGSEGGSFFTFLTG